MPTVTAEQKKEKIARFGKDEKDTGSAKVQVAILTERIASLTEHVKKNKKDNHSRRGLLILVSKRRRLLSYMQRVDLDGYRKLVADLDLRR